VNIIWVVIMKMNALRMMLEVEEKKNLKAARVSSVSKWNILAKQQNSQLKPKRTYCPPPQASVRHLRENRLPSSSTS
jgi:hypothetical protein